MTHFFREHLRKSRSANPAQEGGVENDQIDLGILGKKFKFDQIEHQIEFVGCSALKFEINQLNSLIIEFSKGL